MNKLRLSFLSLIAVLGLAFQSCDDDDSYALGDMAVDWATIVSTSPDTFYLMSDTWGSLWPAATENRFYTPKNGQRIIVMFNPLADKFQQFDHAVKLMDVKEVLTKKVEMLTSVNDADYGNDPITIKDGNLWMSGGHLNLIFLQDMPSAKKHRISLVAPSMELKEDGYYEMELRYNTYEDTTGLLMEGAVSFNLEELMETTEAKGIRLNLNLSDKGMTDMTLSF